MRRQIGINVGRFKDALRRWNGWSLPTRIGLSLGAAGVLITTGAWAFPSLLPAIISSFLSDPRPSVIVPGDNKLEQALNQAKMEGVNYPVPSQDMVVSKFFVRPVLTVASGGTLLDQGNVLALVSVSPLQPANLDVVFSAGQCRMLGKALPYSKLQKTIKLQITTISCVDSSKQAYEASDPAGLGYVTPADNPSFDGIPYVHEHGYDSLPDGNVIVRLNAPLSIRYIGKTAVSW